MKTSNSTACDGGKPASPPRRRWQRSLLHGPRRARFRPRLDHLEGRVTPSTLAVPVNYDVKGAFTDALAVGDFNGDHVPDVATGGPSINLLLGNGDGTLQPAVQFPPSGGNNFVSVVAADFNGDGRD